MHVTLTSMVLLEDQITCTSLAVAKDAGYSLLSMQLFCLATDMVAVALYVGLNVVININHHELSKSKVTANIQ